MAFITLSGTLLDPNGDLAVGDQIRFTHKSTTGETIEGAVSIITVNPAGTYSLPLQYGLVLVEYKDVRTQQFKNLGVATVNGTNPATSIPELLNALVPVSSAELIEFQAILADCVTAQTAAENAATTAEAFAYQLTTTDLIASTATFAAATNIPTSGFTTSGDGGNGSWKQTGLTGQTPSQSPAQLGDALLNDGNGNQWALIPIYGTASPEINSLALGLIADGVIDNYLVLLACKAAASISSANVALPEGVIAYGTTFDLDVENVEFFGVGADRSHDIGGQFTLNSTQLKWIGAASGRMMQVTSPTGAGNQKLVGGGIRGVTFNANSLAGEGLVVISRNSGLYSNIHFHEFTTDCLIVTAHTLGEAADPQLNTFKNITCRQFNNTGNFVNLDGITGANASMNSFYDCSASFLNGDAYVLNNCDNNIFTRCRAVRASGGTGNSIVANGANDLLGSVARSNLFLAFSTNNSPIIARGTETFTYASHNNRIIQADIDNSTPIPTLGTDATFWFDTDRNMQYNSGLIDCAMASTSAQVETLRGKMTTETRRVKNDANNHEIWESGDGLSEWALSIDNTDGNFRLNRLLGSGGIVLDQPLKITNQSAATLAVAGGASALPALPQGYLRVEIDGVTRKIAFYQE
tara:strand:- start:5998 stop:7911 length:1914 start_codon:yes stop_codon:yes gene_type:complete